MDNIYSQFKKITTIMLDVDGVLTDGSVLVLENGEHLRTFNIKDGWAINKAVKTEGLRVIIISAGNGVGMRKRLEKLGIEEINLGVPKKIDTFNEYVEKYQLSMDEIIYMGDDIPDRDILKVVGLSTCPADACDDIKQICDYVSPKGGGKGAVRDIIEKILKLQGKFPS
ncbi:MAG: HAD hydrolase family protein [Cytophagales bacterium]|nr:HAD hydrolase family protein [Cytophagales bacterium]